MTGRVHAAAGHPGRRHRLRGGARLHRRRDRPGPRRPPGHRAPARPRAPSGLACRRPARRHSPPPTAPVLAADAAERADHPAPAAARRLDRGVRVQHGLTLGRRPEVTAIFAANDEMALGAMRALHELGTGHPWRRQHRRLRRHGHGRVVLAPAHHGPPGLHRGRPPQHPEAPGQGLRPRDPSRDHRGRHRIDRPRQHGARRAKPGSRSRSSRGCPARARPRPGPGGNSMRWPFARV